MIKKLDNIISKIWTVVERDGDAAIKIIFPDTAYVESYKQNFLREYLKPTWYIIHNNTVLIMLDADYGVHICATILGQAVAGASHYGAEKVSVI